MSLEKYVEFIYPYFYKKDGSLNIKNIINRKELMNKMWKRYQAKKIPIFLLDKIMINELNLKYKKYKYKEAPKNILFYHNKPPISISEQYKGSKKKLINIFVITRLKQMKFSKSQIKRVLINRIVSTYKIPSKDTKIIKKKATNKNGDISFHKIYDLRYDYLQKKGIIKKELDKLSEYLK